MVKIPVINTKLFHERSFSPLIFFIKLITISMRHIH